MINLLLKILFVSLSTILGASIGSALKCLIDRDDKKSWLTGRSICPNCKTELKWYELIPIISYAIQNGKCRTCKSKIPISCFIYEIICGIPFGLYSLTIM